MDITSEGEFTAYTFDRYLLVDKNTYIYQK